MEAPEVKKLARWSLKQGVATNGIEPYVFEHTGRGFRARTNVVSAKLVLSVPKSMLMNHVTALEHAGLRILAEDGAQFPPEVILSLHLLIEKKLGEKSRFRAFIGSLPSYYTTPYFWGIEAKEMIRARSFDYKEELAVVDDWAGSTPLHWAAFKGNVGKTGVVFNEKGHPYFTMDKAAKKRIKTQ